MKRDGTESTIKKNYYLAGRTHALHKYILARKHNDSIVYCIFFVLFVLLAAGSCCYSVYFISYANSGCNEKKETETKTVNETRNVETIVYLCNCVTARLRVCELFFHGFFSALITEHLLG